MIAAGTVVMLIEAVAAASKALVPLVAEAKEIYGETEGEKIIKAAEELRASNLPLEEEVQRLLRGT